MWHEARKQERKIRGIMVNYKKRAERRRTFYERMKADPTTFLRLQGTNYKVHIDHQNVMSGDNVNMMPWPGDRNIMIDRFDVRAHLDYIPPYKATATSRTTDSDPEEMKLNYERYRTLVMIEASGATEEAYLKQLEFEEQNPKALLEAIDKKEKSAPKATIGYTYQNSAVVMGDENDDESGSSDEDSDIDLDIDVTVNVDELDKEQKNDLNKLADKFNIVPGKYCSLLKADKDEAEHLQRVREEEEARGQLRGRRAKRDRRSLKDKQRVLRSNSPLSYMRRESPSYEPYNDTRSGSDSSSSESSNDEPAKVEYITEFGATTDNTDATKSVTTGDSRQKSSKRSHKDGKRPRSRDRSSSRGRSRSHDRSRDRSRSRRKSRSRSRSRSRRSSRHRGTSSRDYDRSRSRSRRRRSSRSYDRSRSRSRSRSRDGGRSRYTRATDDDKKSLKGVTKVLGVGKTKTPVTADKSKLSAREKLKKRMQMALNKQLKIDKKEERKKKDEKDQEKQARDDQLREISRKWKNPSYRRSRSRSRSSSPAWTSRRSASPDPSSKANSRSRSSSPKRKLSPVDMTSHLDDDDVVHYVYNQ